MKHLRKIVALVIAMVMMVALSSTAFAAVEKDSGKEGPASITITLPTDDAGTDETITYTVYKVFNATNDGSSSNIAYTIDPANGDLTDAMIAAGFAVDAAGNVSFDEDSSMAETGEPTDAAIAAVAAYAKDKIGDFEAKPSDKTLKITGLEYGYYYITTTTGTLVTIDSTNPNAQVNDKNDIPSPPDKTITGVGDGSLDEAGEKALAQVGTKVEYKVEIEVTKGAANYVFHDKMDSGLAYNNDVAVDPAASVANTTTASGDTITVTFDNTWLAANAGKTITITYSATVTSDALQEDPANNTASLDYGEGHTTETDKTEVYNAKFTVTKKDGDGKALKGAGFVIQNADGKYYKLADNAVTWVDSIDDADEHISDEDGNVAPFTGLADGTYTLIEKTVPAGYNKALDSTFTIEAGDYTAANLEQTAEVTNKAGTELPSTGGTGTVIFTVIGAILVLGAGILLVARRRMNVQ